MAKYIGAEPTLYKQMGDILTNKFNFPVSYHQQYRVVIKCKGYKDAQEIAKKYNISSGCFTSRHSSITGNEREIKALQETDLIIEPMHGDQIVTIEQLQAAIKEELSSQMESVPILLENMERLIRNFIIIRDPKFEEYYKDIFWQHQCGKDLFELFDEYKQAAESDPDFDKYKIIALVRCIDDLRLSPDKSTGSGRGGVRPGAGRKKGQKIKEDFELKKTRTIRMTDDELPLVQNYLKELRAAKKEIAADAENYLREQLPAELTDVKKTELKKTLNAALTKFAKDNNLKFDELRIDGDPFIRLMSHEQKRAEE